MELNRRKFVASTAAVLSAAGLGSNVIADESVPVEIAEVFPEAEVVVLENTGEEAVDLGGYVMDWEHEGETNQTDSFDEDVTIEAGEELTVWTGYPSDGDVEADVQIAEYDNGRLNNDGTDVVALLTSDEEVVDTAEATSDGQSYEEYLGDGDDNGGDDNGGDDDDNGGDDDDNGGDDDTGGDGDDNGDDTGGDGDDETGGDDDTGGEEETDGDGDDETGGDDETAGAGDEDCPEDEDESANPPEDECPDEEPEPVDEECPEEDPEPEPEEDC